MGLQQWMRRKAAQATSRQRLRMVESVSMAFMDMMPRQSSKTSKLSFLLVAVLV
jgi:hypothetical protein